MLLSPLQPKPRVKLEGEAHMVVATLGPRQHQAWVQHVILLVGTLVDVDAPTLDLPPVDGDGGVDGHSVVFQGPGLRSLTLDLPTLGIPGSKREGGGIRGWEGTGHRRAKFCLSRTAGLQAWGKGKGATGMLCSRDPPGETPGGLRQRERNRILVPKQIQAGALALGCPLSCQENGQN